MTDKNTLLRQIDEVSFVLDEVRLFLDTHPNDPGALTKYQACRTVRTQAIATYENLYGPLRANGVQPNSCWSWIDGPWPWEV
ncbi:spore coat protein CotJB [Feifania hominis]|uniref:Spore coat protein CotJB n=1 Tax=Feifania hominis TaxID=2763660 RepID=A0A926HTM1_9FIRM|nr:spore coat protein CotJB [Feifania hominis]MBC8535443.1 spore coat protein CotJB [Feifania hominis]